MPVIDWNNLILLEDWAAALQQILAAAEAAVQSPTGQRQEIAELLRTFIKKSPIDAGPLDNIATGAIVDLNISIIGDALRAIRARESALKQQITLITGVTTQARNDAKNLRLDKVNQALAEARMALKALQAANHALDTPDTKLAKKIDTLVAALRDLS
ncbi:hypothetical protein [Hymenobacter psoromatis]|uniref:hypothetical protein n=1 Tax=Hymenobacter psoromatis TaxID=1484116 RepID=UPI001CC07C17|nr:hypothetical protein [Hymenobacter psoromatis]